MVSIRAGSNLMNNFKLTTGVQLRLLQHRHTELQRRVVLGACDGGFLHPAEQRPHKLQLHTMI